MINVRKTRILVVLLSCLHLKTFLLHIWYTLFAFSNLISTSLSTLFTCCTSLPRYEKELTSCSCWSPSVMARWFPVCCPMFITFVLPSLIFIPQLLHVLSRPFIISCNWLLVSATNVKSSAYCTFQIQVVIGVLSL